MANAYSGCTRPSSYGYILMPDPSNVVASNLPLLSQNRWINYSESRGKLIIIICKMVELSIGRHSVTRPELEHFTPISGRKWVEQMAFRLPALILVFYQVRLLVFNWTKIPTSPYLANFLVISTGICTVCMNLGHAQQFHTSIAMCFFIPIKSTESMW